MSYPTPKVIEKTVDIEKAIRQARSPFLRNLPRFIVRGIERFVHQHDLNRILATFGHLKGADFNDAMLREEFHIKSKVVGKENVPDSGRFIFVANHSMGALDGMVYMNEIGKIVGETKSIINELLMHLKPLQPLFADVNVLGTSSKEQILALDKLFASDVTVLLFPAGVVSRRIDGKIQDLPWKKTFVTKAVQHKRDVIPVYIDGRLSNFFYTFARWRVCLGIKMTLEILFLPREVFRSAPEQINLTIGKPIPYQTFDKRNTSNKWAQLVRQHVYELAENPQAVFQADRPLKP